jgi:hypothetical protein
MTRVPGLVGSRPSDLDKLRWHIEFFVMNLHVTYLKDPKRYIALPKSSNKYRKGTLFGKKFKLSYEYSVKKVVKFLLDNKYIKKSASSTIR